jgi:hypothetical protein
MLASRRTPAGLGQGPPAEPLRGWYARYSGVRTAAGEPLLHTKAYYTLQRAPAVVSGARADAMPPIQFVPEMTDLFPGLGPARLLDEATEEAFRAAWERLCDALEARVTPDDLKAISRWSTAQMEGFVPAAGWIRHLPMAPMGSLGDSVVFGQAEPQSSPVILPSERPIVHRRLVVAAAYDRARKQIASIVVSIRGWAEE